VIYLDHHAATPVCAAARAAMDAAREVAWANPASVHAAGRAARALLERARREVAEAIGAAAADVVLTSGGTEACNLGIGGLGGALRGAHAISTRVEHPAVARALDRLEREAGTRVTRLDVPGGRAPDAAAMRAALRPDTRVIAVQWVNHETGSVLPIAEYAEVARAAGVALFVDATQAAGKRALDAAALGADLIALASHKLGGPAGAGALWIRRGTDVAPVLAGGGQERGRRPGTPDVLGAVGFGAACTALPERLAAQPRVARLRERATAALREMGAVINGAAGENVATAVNASVRGARGEELVAALDLEGVCASSGAACSSGLSEPSPVLLAMHPDEPWRAGAALRLSFGPETTESDVETALAALRRVLARLAPAET
jgi:cysteine desulfurase